MIAGISIIVPVFNAARFLRRSMDSILNQTYSCIEVICIDDGSTDGCGAILDEYAASDVRVKVIHQENKGVSISRNVGLAAASNDWIGFVDPDDWIEPYFVERHMSECQIGDSDMTWCDYMLDDSVGSSYVAQNCAENSDAYLRGLFSGLWGGVWNKVFRRKFLIDHCVKFPSERILVCEDLCFMVNLLIHRPRIKHIEQSGYHYVRHSDSALAKDFTIERLNSVIRVEEILEALLNDVSADQWEDQVFRSRREEIKFNAYSSPNIPDSVFYGTYPEVRRIDCFAVPFWHKLLFILAVHRCRWFIIGCLSFVRRIRRSINRRGICHI